MRSFKVVAPVPPLPTGRVPVTSVVRSMEVPKVEAIVIVSVAPPVVVIPVPAAMVRVSPPLMVWLEPLVPATVKEELPRAHSHSLVVLSQARVSASAQPWRRVSSLEPAPWNSNPELEVVRPVESSESRRSIAIVGVPPSVDDEPEIPEPAVIVAT